MDGRQRRLRRILNKDTGRSLVIAVDHGMALGAMTGIVDIAKRSGIWMARERWIAGS
jgi:DhnA family fructose-bisphosphate aldolase class Ia